MPALTASSIPVVGVDPRVFNSKRNPHGMSIKEAYPATWPAKTPPTHLYLVYLGIDANQKLIVRQLYDSLRDRTVAVAEADLFRQAKGDEGVAEDKGVNFDSLVFEEPCYFTIALDHASWQLYNYDLEDHDPFVFISKKQKVVNGQPVTVSYDPNYSFLEATVQPIPGLTPYSVRCVNYFKADLTGRTLSRLEKQYYGFEIYIRVPFSLRGTGEEFVTILVDPDGQNQGPP